VGIRGLGADKGKGAESRGESPVSTSF
jgi:hypothetical protein